MNTYLFVSENNWFNLFILIPIFKRQKEGSYWPNPRKIPVSELRGLSNRFSNAALASKCRKSVSMVCLVINGTPELHTASTCKAQRPPWNKVQKYCKVRVRRGSGNTQNLLHMKVSWIYEPRAAVVACMTPSQNQASQHSSLEERDHQFCLYGEELLTVAGYWGRENQLSLRAWPLAG